MWATKTLETLKFEALKQKSQKIHFLSQKSQHTHTFVANITMVPGKLGHARICLDLSKETAMCASNFDILKFLKIASKDQSPSKHRILLRTNICICVRKVISNARMIQPHLVGSKPASHLLLFFKPALQLWISQVGVHLLSIPA